MQHQKKRVTSCTGLESPWVDVLALLLTLSPCQSNCCIRCYWDREKHANSKKQAASVARCDWALRLGQKRKPASRKMKMGCGGAGAWSV